MITLSSHIRWPAVVAFALVPMLRIYLVYLTTLAADKTRTVSATIRGPHTLYLRSLR